VLAALASLFCGAWLLFLDIGRWLKWGIWQPYRLEDALAGSDFDSWVRHPKDWIGMARMVGGMMPIPVSFWLLIPLPAILAGMAMAFRQNADELNEKRLSAPS
jgi:hypothetical protein